MSSQPLVVIIGSSAAGVSAAFALRKSGFSGRVCLIDADPREPYERPPLSKTLLNRTGEMIRPIAPASDYADAGIELLLGRTVCELLPDRHQVVLDDGTTVDAWRVVLATGVAARPLCAPGAALDNVLYLRDAADAQALASRLAARGPLVVVGGGFIGLELAAEARAAGIDTTVVELGPVPLLGPAGRAIGQLVRELHEANGVRFHVGAQVSRIAGSSTAEEVVLGDGTRLPTSVIVAGVGVVPRQELAEMAGIATDGGVVVDKYGRSSNPWIWAAGDIAVQPHPHLDRPGRIEHWDSALRHGEAVGQSIAGQPTAFASVPFAWSDQYGITLQSFGRRCSHHELVLRADAVPNRFIGFWLHDGRIAAVMGLDMPREVRAARQLIERGCPVTANELADPGTDLRTLSKRAAARDDDRTSLRNADQ